MLMEHGSKPQPDRASLRYTVHHIPRDPGLLGHTLELILDFLVPGPGPKAPGRNSVHLGGIGASGASLSGPFLTKNLLEVSLKHFVIF